MSAEKTVRIGTETHQLLSTLKQQTGASFTELLADSVERFHEQMVIERLNTGYAELRNDKQAWQDELAERATWDNTLDDGLEDE